MPLSSGSRLGPYEIVAPLGSGGMGEVYRARDSRLARDVAIKVLPAHLSTNPDLRTRFEREARAVAALNHPHICVIHDVGREGDVDYLVMELVEGETLHDRLTKGPLPAAAALKLAVEIASALDRAHRAGIIHRDLKPSNVMTTKSGAKLMDFGLARAAAITSPASDVTQSPSMTRPLTAHGSIVGTLQYMAPEQLEGTEADARADLWAFGCVLYEMATGKRAFDGKTSASVISSIMRDEPRAMSELAPLTPPALERVVKRCLAKDPDDRWQTARDLMHEIEWVAKEGGMSTGARGLGSGSGGLGAPPSTEILAAVPRRRPRVSPAWIVASVCALAAVAALVTRPGRVAPPAVRFTISQPPGLQEMEWPTLSPDGRLLAFIAADSTSNFRIYVRDMNSLEAKPLAGTERAGRPFWSPDSRQLAYFSESALKKIAIDGGTPEVIREVRGGSDGTWGPKGIILFDGGQGDSIWRVDASGGPITGATTLDRQTERFHGWPWFLPDGEHFLFLSSKIERAESELCVGRLDSKDVKRLGPCEARAIYAAPGSILTTRAGQLIARPFDAESLEFTGEAVPIGGAVQDGPSRLAHFSASETGSYAMLSELDPGQNAFLWVDREGREIPGSHPPSGVAGFDLSPDETRVVYDAPNVELTGLDIWMWDLRRSVATRLTFDRDADEVLPVWSPDGQKIAYCSSDVGAFGVRVIDLKGGEPQVLYQGQDHSGPEDWSRDGRWIGIFALEGNTSDVAFLSASGPSEPTRLMKTEFEESGAAFSPDGRWIAYFSDESGREEVYVQAFPESHGKVQVSTTGGEQPSWRADGREFYYVGSDGTLYAVPIQTGAAFEAGIPVKLFDRNLNRHDEERNRYVVAADGRRILVNVPNESAAPPRFTVAMGWAAAASGK